jgi:hypothetical protein
MASLLGTLEIANGGKSERYIIVGLERAIIEPCARYQGPLTSLDTPLTLEYMLPVSNSLVSYSHEISSSDSPDRVLLQAPKTVRIGSGVTS